MTDLIVDFPNRKRRFLSLSCSKPKSKSLQFSEMSQVKFIQPIDEADVDTLWYSRKEYQAMRHATKKNVQQAQRSLLSNPQDVDSCMINGIENLLTPALIKKTKACRAQCTQAVLAEQERQRHAGVYDPESLALSSKSYSRSSMRRAQTIASLHAR